MVTDMIKPIREHHNKHMLIPSQCYLMETRDEVTKISRQCVETLQEEPKLKWKKSNIPHP